MKKRVAMMWSGGKDSSLALFKVLNKPEYEVVYLVSTFSAATQRLSMHGVKEQIIEKQSEAIGIPLIKMFTDGADHESYERSMFKLMNQLKDERINEVVFGDIFLEDLRKYRESNLSKVGVNAHFPLWKKETKELINEFLELGFKTICCCIDSSKLSDDFLGQIIDYEWIATLPNDVDVCGENGEFHTLCIDGPIFRKPLSVDYEGVVQKEYSHENNVFKFGFADLLLKE